LGCCCRPRPTRNAIPVGLLTLMKNPDQLELLRKEPSRLRCTQSGIAPPAVEEILRWSSPVNYFARTATKDTTVRGVDIEADDRIVMWYASASRDRLCSLGPIDSTLPDPDATLRTMRRRRGSHLWQGAILARKRCSPLRTTPRGSNSRPKRAEGDRTDSSTSPRASRPVAASR
jgi:hypothetical protein